MCDTSETCDASSTRLRTRRAQDLSYKLTVKEFDDLTNTCCSEVDRDRTTTQTAPFEEECGCLTSLHHETTTNRRVHVRSLTRKHQPRAQELAL